MTNPTPSYDDLMTQLAAERLHNPWWTSVGTTKTGAPRHPLYLRADTPRQLYNGRTP